MSNAGTRFTTIRRFIEEALTGQHKPEEILRVLSLIEQGIGLEEHDRAMAEKMQDLPSTDKKDPVWVRGYEQGLAEGYKAGRRDERDDKKSRRFKKADRKAQRAARKAQRN